AKCCTCNLKRLATDLASHILAKAHMESRSPGPVTDLDRSVLFLTTAFATRLSKGASRRLKMALGIGLMEWRVVCNLGVEPGLSAVRIAEISGVDKSVVSRAVTELERQGLIAPRADQS